ncbi:IS630 transposase-related protein [Halocynthiibacter namhaensis]|uniref:IS630 transposase-related protein n=1 Tax=Halocynthiibacter namhaensis TaxID=1290553 RepID=UPI00068F6A31|nr:IS630 transposase-related protein [Halocynthiibacter namhaensis]
MGKPLSLDLRHRICAYISAGNSCRAAGRVFGVSAATAVRYGAEHREHGEVIAKPQGRPAGQFGKLSAHVDFLTDLVEAEPDITLQELANALENTYGVRVSDLLCMSNLVHASLTKEHDNNDNIQGSFRRAA